MKKLTPIPIPIAARWREFRARILPLLVFSSVVAVVVLIWRGHPGQMTMQGVGDGIRSTVTAPQTVRVQQWLVEPHTVVAAGTPLVVVTPVDARVDFDLLRSLHEMARLQSQPSLAEDNAMNFERIRIELLKTKSELAIASVKLEQAERDVSRSAALHRDQLLSADLYELSLSTRDALQAEVNEKTKAVAQIEERLDSLRPIGEPESGRGAAPENQWLTKLRNAQEAALKNLEPQTLVAPITGMVGVRQRQTGEFVPAGEPLLTVNSLRADNVIAYLRQPYRFDPQVGMTARITTRTSERAAFESQIIQIGAQVEVLTNALALLRPGTLVDSGLPIIVAIPEGIHIRPGEIVDIMIATEPGEDSALPAAQSQPRQPQL